jgi:type VI secretion system secreted protein Hcp
MVNMTLLVPTIPGESAIKNHVNEIVIEAFQISLTQGASGGQQTSGSGTGQVKIGDLVVTKAVDKATPLLFQAAAQGKHWEKDNVVLTCMKAGGEAVEYFKLYLGQPFISEIHTGSTKGDDVVYETITFNFKTLKEEYQPQAGSGLKEAVISGSWDIAANAPM